MAKIFNLLLVSVAVSGVSGRTLFQAPAPAGQTVTEVAQATPSLSTLVQALTNTNLSATLNDPSLVATVFAPTNNAFTALANNMGYTQAQLLALPSLKSILLYHVLPGVAAESSTLKSGQMLATELPGQSLVVLANTPVVIIGGTQSSANVTMANIPADRAIIHIINAVLLPSQSALNSATVSAPTPAPAPALATAPVSSVIFTQTADMP